VSKVWPSHGRSLVKRRRWGRGGRRERGNWGRQRDVREKWSLIQQGLVLKKKKLTNEKYRKYYLLKIELI